MTLARCLMILADGARADVFEELLAAGRLPHVARHIVARGGYARGVTVFPSTTGPAYMPFLTGCHPGTCDVPGIRWLDKAAYWGNAKGRGRRSYVGIETFEINRDIRPDIATLFSLLPNSYSVFNSVCRGAGLRGNLTRIMRMWYWYYAHLTDRWGFVDAAATAKLLDLIRRDFRFGFIVFPGIDEYAHLADPRHPRTLEAYAVMDRAIGLVAERLQRMRRYDETMLWIVSDHGLSATHTHFCVNTFLEARGIRTFFYPLVMKRGCMAANMMSGNGMTHLYFRSRNGDGPLIGHDAIERAYQGIHDSLLAEPAVDIIATREAEGAVRVASRRGVARIGWDGTTLTYAVAQRDPFGYGPLPARMTATECLARTAASDYPDAPYQLAALFTSRRAGDVILSASPGYDLRDAYEHPEHKGSHGSLHREHMMVPVAASVPLPPAPMRTVDIFPQVLTQLGRTVPTPIDGRL